MAVQSCHCFNSNFEFNVMLIPTLNYWRKKNTHYFSYCFSCFHCSQDLYFHLFSIVLKSILPFLLNHNQLNMWVPIPFIVHLVFGSLFAHFLITFGNYNRWKYNTKSYAKKMIENFFHLFLPPTHDCKYFCTNELWMKEIWSYIFFSTMSF